MQIVVPPIGADRTPFGPRALTHAELDHFDRFGWSRLVRLIDPQLASELLERSLRFTGPVGVDSFLGEQVRLDTVVADYHHPSREDELMHKLATHPVMGQQSAALLGAIAAGIRLLADTLVGSFPTGNKPQPAPAGDLRVFEPVRDFHQGQPFIPFDRRVVSFRIALEATPEGAPPMRFLSGSHRFGLLGREVTGDPAKLQPAIAACPLSPPFPLAPGDATVHVSDIVRGYPTRAGRPRGYVLAYLPADACYTGMPSSLTDGLGLAPLEPVEHPAFPLVG
jgi:hypothetical protein